MENFRKEKYKQFYEMKIRYLSKGIYLNDHEASIKNLNDNIKLYDDVIKRKPTEIGVIIAEERLIALHRIKDMLNRHFNKKKSILESFGCTVYDNGIVWIDSIDYGYIYNWRIIARKCRDKKQLSFNGK